MSLGGISPCILWAAAITPVLKKDITIQAVYIHKEEIMIENLYQTPPPPSPLETHRGAEVYVA